MSRTRLAALALLCLVGVSCSFDFVAPEPGVPISRLSLIFITAPSKGDTLSVSGSLKPGIAADGAGARVPDTRLVVLGTPLAADSTVADTSLVLRWSATIPGALDDTSPMVLQAPVVEGREAPPALVASLRREADGSTRGRTWRPGEDLVLPLRPASDDAGVDSDVWNVAVLGWGPEGPPISLVTLLVRAPVGDTVRVPAGWFPDVALDSLQAQLRYIRQFSSASADRSYLVTATVDQILSWAFSVAKP